MHIIVVKKKVHVIVVKKVHIIAVAKVDKTYELEIGCAIQME